MEASNSTLDKFVLDPGRMPLITKTIYFVTVTKET